MVYRTAGDFFAIVAAYKGGYVFVLKVKANRLGGGAERGNFESHGISFFRVVSVTENRVRADSLIVYESAWCGYVAADNGRTDSNA